ncbi:AAA family ATPase [Photobacterium damselae]|uniref:AAA family ATPase n=1 Tax=Photobacterium damselae TaxID=38293 RepID=UPI003D7DE10D
MAKPQQPTIVRKDFRLNKLSITKLKGLNDCEIDFSPHRVTAIMGINGSGKSSILHALACCFKPIGSSSNPDNRFPDFFTPHTHSTWTDTHFTLTHSYTQVETKNGNSKRIESTVEYGKNNRWRPIYARRPERPSQYIGLQNLPTLADNRGAGRFANYKVQALEHPKKQMIIEKMSYVLGRQYDSLVLCKSRTKTFWGLGFNGLIYSEHTMGAGEKRVVEILRQLFSPELKNGVLIIDELEALLHSSAFARLVEVLVSASETLNLEVVFTTHRETITDFRERINICGIWNTGTNVMTLPNLDPRIFNQLTGKNQKLLKIYVEDDLAQLALDLLLEEEQWQDYVSVSYFGAGDNAYVVLAGLLLSQQPINDVLCVLDGDVDKTNIHRLDKLKKYLSGEDNQAVQFRNKAIENIRQFVLEYQTPVNTKAAPEYNHKRWLEEIEEDNGNRSLLAASKQVAHLPDWHRYYTELEKYCTKRHIQESVLETIQQSNPEKWTSYVSEIRTWIRAKLQEKGVIKPEEKKVELAE